MSKCAPAVSFATRWWISALVIPSPTGVSGFWGLYPWERGGVRSAGRKADEGGVPRGARPEEGLGMRLGGVCDADGERDSEKVECRALRTPGEVMALLKRVL